MAIAGVGSDLLFFFSSFSTWKFDGEKDYGVFIHISGNLEAVQWDLLDIMEITLWRYGQLHTFVRSLFSGTE